MPLFTAAQAAQVDWEEHGSTGEGEGEGHAGMGSDGECDVRVEMIRPTVHMSH